MLPPWRDRRDVRAGRSPTAHSFRSPRLFKPETPNSIRYHYSFSIVRVGCAGCQASRGSARSERGSPGAREDLRAGDLARPSAASAHTTPSTSTPFEGGARRRPGGAWKPEYTISPAAMPGFSLQGRLSYQDSEYTGGVFRDPPGIIEITAAAPGKEIELVSMRNHLVVPPRPQPWSTHRVMDLTLIRWTLGYEDAWPPREALGSVVRWLAANPPEPGGTGRAHTAGSVRLFGGRPPDGPMGPMGTMGRLRLLLEARCQELLEAGRMRPASMRAAASTRCRPLATAISRRPSPRFPGRWGSAGSAATAPAWRPCTRRPRT